LSGKNKGVRPTPQSKSPGGALETGFKGPKHTPEENTGKKCSHSEKFAPKALHRGHKRKLAQKGPPLCCPPKGEKNVQRREIPGGRKKAFGEKKGALKWK